jgi:nucleoid-associated protein YgaU
VAATPAPAPAPAVASQAAAPQPREVVAVAESHPHAASTGSLRVRAGDTLWSIAERRVGAGAGAAKVLGEVQRLSALNGLQDPDLIFAGQRLRT